ncbi:uncharacterized protein TA16440 [Theileria annulata]|uniref:Uncharacterized protein n=1 Tax=Theileria annulata TaxID=5874 RepID=Q4UIW4_THEAN|nr:uncharacterized protein TA16440 [Theileria annulata]CAI72975.1 hypothetical protein TA16440 [Theileria annulata]|eukprot:XP_953653.1 hypothetical protein TA16440 [Theileria annulata]
MEDIIKYNYYKSFGRRYQYIDNVNDIIANTIKNELQIYEKGNDKLLDKESGIKSEDNSGETSEHSEDLDHIRENPYSYILDQFKDVISSEQSSDFEDLSNENKTTVRIKFSEQDQTKNDDPLDSGQNFRLGPKSKKIQEKEQNQTDLNSLENFGADEDKKINFYLPHVVLRKLNSNKDPLNLNKVFSNLERNLSDVRYKYQKTLSNLALKSSAVRRNYRLTCFNPVHPKNIRKIEPDQEHNQDKINNKRDVDKNNFDLNKWLDELPNDLKNFIEDESISNSLNSIKDFKESKQLKDNEINKMDLNNRDAKDLHETHSEEETESVINIEKEDENPVSDKGYMEVIQKDYIDPLKDVISEDIKTGLDEIKQGITDLYNNSPKIFQNIFGSSEPDKELDKSRKPSKELNSYYLETNRDAVENLDSPDGEYDPFDNDYKIFDMKEKYQSFDISDKKPPQDSTPVVNRDFNENYVVYKENQVKSPEKVVKSVGEYNIGFLSNLWTINEKCKLMRNENARTNTINPWFGSPAKEAMYRQRSLDNSNQEYKECTTVLDKERNMKYKIVMDENNKPVYLIDNIEPGDEERAKKYKDTVLTIQRNRIKNRNNNLDSNLEDGVYDPLKQFQQTIEQTKLINETDLAILGRPKVKRTNRKF